MCKRAFQDFISNNSLFSGFSDEKQREGEEFQVPNKKSFYLAQHVLKNVVLFTRMTCNLYITIFLKMVSVLCVYSK